MRQRIAIPLALIAAIAATAGCTPNLVHVKDTPRRARVAVLVLPGEFYSPSGYRAMRDWFPAHDFDVYIPDYESRDGLEACVANLAAFVDEHDLDEYDELHVMAYILGGWTLNLYLRDHELPNLTRVVYVRSPIEERMAQVVLDRIPTLVRITNGVTPTDMRDTPYPPLDKGDRQVGLIIENRAIPYLRRHKQEVLDIGELRWSPDSFDQQHDDHMYVWLHHDEMYDSFDLIGPELLHFFDNGSFSADARRVPFEGDPFAD